MVASRPKLSPAAYTYRHTHGSRLVQRHTCTARCEAGAQDPELDADPQSKSTSLCFVPCINGLSPAHIYICDTSEGLALPRYQPGRVL